MTETVLIVDDGSNDLRMAEYAIGQKLGYHAVTAGSGEETVRWMLSGRQPQPDLILLDLTTSRMGGLQVIREIKSRYPQLPVIALIPYGDDNCTEQAVQAGISDFLSKPVALDRLKLSLRNALTLRRMGDVLLRLERQVTGHVCFSDVIGHSAAMREALVLAKVAAASKLPVWIEGEPGTGKELLARAIHGNGDRAGKPFVTIDCKGLSDEMAEAILFGQEKASGSGLYFVLGKVREAEKGTLFLKGIGSLKPELQQRLLETLDEGTIRPVGAVAPVAVDVRLIVACSQPIKPFMAAGSFSHVLHRRFNGLSIVMPPLRQRRDDIALLAKHFIVTYALAENRSMIGLTEEALQHLAAETWPGNIHQLSRLMWQAMMMCNQELLDSGNLRLIEQWQSNYHKDYGDNILAPSPLLFDGTGRMKKLKSIEEEIIRLALRHNGGCMTRAARELGIGRSTLYRRVNDIGIDGYISRANQAMRPMTTVSSADRS